MKFQIGLIIAGLLMVPMVAAADEPAAAPVAPPTVDDFQVLPCPHITLMPGEKVKISVFDKRFHQAVLGKDVTWEINGQAVGHTEAAWGMISKSGGDTSAGVLSYKAPAKLPEKNVLEFTATLHPDSGPLVIKGSIILTDEANCFIIDGDTGVGRQEVAMVLDSSVNAQFGPGARIIDNVMVITLTGARKDKPTSRAMVELTTGAHTTPGDYAWFVPPQLFSRIRQPIVGMSLVLPEDDKMYISLGAGGARRLVSLPGATTILKPDSSDPDGTTKGFFCGQLDWSAHGGRINNTFYLNVTGHFSVPLIQPPAPPAPAAAPPVAN